MNSIFKGDLSTAKGRAVAWIDSLFIDHAVFRLVWGNFAAVIPGKIYRCNHPTPARLRRMTRSPGPAHADQPARRTESGSDALSREAARELGLAFHDMAFESRGAPQRERILRLHADLSDDADAGGHALQVRRRPGRAGSRTDGAVRRRRRRPTPCGSCPGDSVTSGRPGPASSTRSSCSTSARRKGGSRSWTGCATITTKSRYAGTSAPTGWPALSTTGCWCTNNQRLPLNGDLLVAAR